MTTIAHFVEALDRGRPADGGPAHVPDRPIVVIAGGTDATRRTGAAGVARGWATLQPQGHVVSLPPAAEWPFLHPLADLPSGAGPVLLFVADLPDAFVNAQGPGARLVTTQSAYLLEAWLHALQQRPGSLLLATADRSTLGAHAPEAEAGRGPWRQVALVAAAEGAATHHVASRAAGGDAVSARLAAAFAQADVGARLAACVAALDVARTPAALVAMGSACMEVNDLGGARHVLDEALAAAPEWAAAHFESGKLWLRAEDMEAAARAFAASTERLPGFASAWANLGGVLGELDRPDEALRAFRRALDADPSSHQALNNVGVVCRELGRLPDSEAAFRRVIALAPHLAMGHYNLGHTLFLQGRYQAALSSYVEGQKRDPERNPVQASRLALARLASGDAEGALRDLRQCTAGLPPAYRRQLLADTHAVAWALLTHRPDLPGWKAVADWIGAELARA